MHTEQHQSTSPAVNRSENATETWERLCAIWDAALHRAEQTDSNQAAAELTPGISKRERSRLVSLYRMTSRA